MIELKKLAKRLESQLNDGLTGDISYKLFTDTGTFKKAYRERNSVITYINGIYSNVSSDISNVYDGANGFLVGSMTNEVVLVIPCKDDDEDVYAVIHSPNEPQPEPKLVEIGNNTFISQIRKRLDDIAAKTLYFTETDSENKSYDVSVAFQLADTGIREQLPELGDCFTFSMQAFYNIIESGDNSRKWKIYLDDIILPYSSMSLQRQTTNETTVYANKGRSTSTLIVADTFSCGIEIPSLLMEFNSIVKDFLLNGSNGYAHVAKIVAGDTTVYKLVVLSEDTATASGVLNVGLKLQLNETKEAYGLIAFSPSNYIIYRCKIAASFYEHITFDSDFGITYTDYWGYGFDTNGIMSFYPTYGELLIFPKGTTVKFDNAQNWQQIQ